MEFILFSLKHLLYFYHFKRWQPAWLDDVCCTLTTVNSYHINSQISFVCEAYMQMVNNKKYTRKNKKKAEKSDINLPWWHRAAATFKAKPLFLTLLAILYYYYSHRRWSNPDINRNWVSELKWRQDVYYWVDSVTRAVMLSTRVNVRDVFVNTKP